MDNPQTIRELAAKWHAWKESVLAQFSEDKNARVEVLQAIAAGNCADELDVLANTMEVRLGPKHTEEEIESCFASDNKGDVRNAEGWSSANWFCKDFIGERKP